MNATEIKEQLLAMDAAPLFINGHRVDRFYLDCFIVDQAGSGYDLEQSVDVDTATQLVLAVNRMVNGE